MRKHDIAILTSIGENASFVRQVEKACENAARNITKFVQPHSAAPIDAVQGRFAEAWHAETFNVDAVLQRTRYVAAMLPGGNSHHSPDITVVDQGDTVQEYGLKYYKNGPASVNAQKEYDGQSRLIPADQMPEAQEYLHQQILKDYATERENRITNAQELERVQEKLTDRVKYNGVESEPLTRKEAETGTRKVLQGEQLEIRPVIDTAKLIEESLRSGAIAAGVTISMTLAPRVFDLLVQRCQNGEWPPEAIQSVFQGVGEKTVEAGLRGAFATSMTMSAKAGFLGEIARDLDPTLIGTLTYIAFEGIKDFARFKRGELPAEWLADSLMRKSIAATAGAYGATIGQLVIPVPIVGAMLGAVVGSLVAQSGYQVLETVSEAYFRTAELEQMIRINSLLALEWNTFVSRYEQWVRHASHYARERRQWEERLHKRRQLGQLLDRQLLPKIGGF